MSLSVMDGIDELLNEKWGEYFSYDRKIAKETGVVILCWTATGSPLPLNLQISDEALEKGRINWRELHRKIKLCLPDNIIKQKISEANSFLRDANRRNLKDVEKDLAKWISETAQDVKNMFGREAEAEFLKESELDADIRKGSIQALHKNLKDKIDRLKLF